MVYMAQALVDSWLQGPEHARRHGVRKAGFTGRALELAPTSAKVRGTQIDYERGTLYIYDSGRRAANCARRCRRRPGCRLLERDRRPKSAAPMERADEIIRAAEAAAPKIFARRAAPLPAPNAVGDWMRRSGVNETRGWDCSEDCCS